MDTSPSKRTESALQALEHLRNSTRGNLWRRVRMIWGAVITLALVLVFQVPGLKNFIRGRGFDPMMESNDIVMLGFAAFLVTTGAFVSFFLWFRAKNAFVRESKERYVRPLMLELFPDMVYEPEGKMPREVFDACGLFRSDYNRYNGDDLFQGIINDRLVEFSELSVSREERSSGRSTSSGSSNTSFYFTGLFMRVELNKPLHNRVVIDASRLDSLLQQHKVPSFIQNLIQRFLPDYGPQVTTGIAEFDQRFQVFGPNEAEVRELLTQEFTAQLMGIYDTLVSTNGNSQSQAQHAFSGAASLFKLCIHKNSLFFALNNVCLFDFPFHRNALSAQDVLSQSLLSIRMMTDLAKAC